jgi:alcohol dehydrogenase (cytochrome c)
MPAFEIDDGSLADLIWFLRTLPIRDRAAAMVHRTVKTTAGRTIEGTVLKQSASDLQIRDADNRIYLLRGAGDPYRVVTSDIDWPGYNADPGGNRYTTLSQIDKANVRRLVPKWTFTLSNAPYLEMTPVVVEGIMYATSVNECFALDAGSGRQLWHYQRSRTRGLVGNAAGGINRGVALAKGRVFMVTDNAHMIALDRYTGNLLWEAEMADWRQNYNATAAPLAAGNLVISGTAGGDDGVRGFLAAYDQETGKEVRRFWTAPKPGEPLAETWQGEDINHPGATAWMTGTYDAQTDTLYWPTGNPGNDMNGDERRGDNLYSSSVLAIDVKSGSLKWYYQFTPHNLWDASEPPVLVDAVWHVRPRKLLVQANRNGFFYIFDRITGQLLLAKPFARMLTWASGIDKNGRPIVNPDQEPTIGGTKVCPSLYGATNWFSTAFNPVTGLYYVQTLEGCSVFAKRSVDWVAGRSYMGGTVRDPAGESPHKILRAIDIQTGSTVWEMPQNGTGMSFGGLLSTASGLVFVCDDSGSFAAVDASNGKRLWEFQTSQEWKSSPMVYSFDGEERIVASAGQTIIAFGLMR